ncbi:MAG: deoxyribonuclease IV [Planctomycetaceae bacterium]
MILGAHVRRRGIGLRGVVHECVARGADCAQVFLSNPRAWAPPLLRDEDAAAYRETWRASGLGPLAAHAPYPVNVASHDATIRARSRRLLEATARAAGAVGADLVVVHSGSRGPASAALGRRRAAEVLREVVGAAPPGVTVAVELMAGTSGAVASTVEEAVALLAVAGEDRLALCLDTCHLFATGYALDTAEGVEALVERVRDAGLLARLALVHANDSAFGRGEHRDRHADVGEGTLDWAALARSALSSVPWVLETPGDEARQRADLVSLRALAG